MELTRRQTTFIERLVDLYHEARGPIHYSTLAQRLGVSRFTAYDMLRLLEEKGLVTSGYHLTAGRSGPGRSEVLFQPTEQARLLVAELAGPNGEKDWEAVKRRMVENLAGAHPRDRALAEAVLARMPRDSAASGGAPVRYCLEVMTIVALRLKGHAQRAALARWLPALLDRPAGGDRASLSLLGGWALSALGAGPNTDDVWRLEALAHLRRYQALVIEMSPKSCRLLSDGLAEVFAPLLAEAPPRAANPKVNEKGLAE